MDLSVVLWPRQEVLQLVIPQLGTAGRNLSNNVAIKAIRKLNKVQTVEGKISFDRWLVVAKDILKWNDNCISLFWEMLLLAIYYLNCDSSNVSQILEEQSAIELDYVAIFLIFHINDAPTARPSSPTIAYDTMWPSAEGEFVPSSPTSSPTQSKSQKNKFNSLGSPGSAGALSPKSPKGSPNSSPNKRSHLANNPRTPRSTAQYLHTVRQKIPIILKALGLEDVDNGMMSDLNISGTTEVSMSKSTDSFETDTMANNRQYVDFPVSRRTVDALGLIICGGYSREQHISAISNLHAFWSNDGSDNSNPNAMRYSRDFNDTLDGPNNSILFSELSNWIELHLSMNDLLYPVSISPSYGSLTPNGKDQMSSEMDPINNKDNNNNSLKPQHPSRVLTSLASLSRFTPTVINGCSSTVQHVVTCGLNRSLSGIRKSKSSSNDRGRNENDGYDVSNSETNIGESANSGMKSNSLDFDDIHKLGDDDLELSKYDLSHDMKFKESFLSDNGMHPVGSNKPELSLPQFASVNGCTDCEMVIGSVFGALIVNGCERVKITCACKKLIVLNCLECEFNIASLSSTIISGDSRNLIFGPYNTSYRNLKHHLKIASLQSLISHHDKESSNAVHYNNTWSNLCDVNACLESVPTANSPTGYALDAISCFPMTFPTPSSNTATIVAAEDFRTISIPFKQEYLSYEFCPIVVEMEYLESLRVQNEKISSIKNQISVSLKDSIQSNNSDDTTDSNNKAVTSSVLTKKFMEWLVTSGNVKEVLDLIRMDNDKQNSLSHHS